MTLCVSCGHTLALASSDLAPGPGSPPPPCPRCGRSPVLGGRFLLESKLGQGSFATTYRARRLCDGGAVAIKELLVRGLPGFKVEALFRREADVLRQIHHPAVPRFHEELIEGEGRWLALYQVHDLVEGETLATELEHRRYTAPEVLEVLAELLEVLASLHALSPPVIHRDIKPENVVRRRDGRLALIDFGSVQAALASPEGGSTLAGTFGFMAPEQLLGQASPASDLYAVAVLGITLLTRRPPHTLMDSRHQLGWREALPELPVPLDRLLARMLEADPARRAHDAGALARQARTLLLRGLPPPRRRRRAWPRLLTAAAALGLFAGLIAGASQVGRVPGRAAAPSASATAPSPPPAPTLSPSPVGPPGPMAGYWAGLGGLDTAEYPWTPGPSACAQAGNCLSLEDDFEGFRVKEECQALARPDRGESQIVSSLRHLEHTFAGEPARCQRDFLFGKSCRMTCVFGNREAGAATPSVGHEIAEAVVLELRNTYGPETRYFSHRGGRYWAWDGQGQSPFRTQLRVNTKEYIQGSGEIRRDVTVSYETPVPADPSGGHRGQARYWTGQARGLAGEN